MALAPNSTAPAAPLAEQQRALTATLSAFTDPQQRLAWLIEQARARPLLDAALRTDAHRVEGCLARLWFVPEFRAGRCHFQSDSDSLVVKSIAGLLCEFYSGHAPAEILAHHPQFLAQLGITQHLTPNRRNALARVWENIRAFAQAHQPSGTLAPAEGERDGVRGPDDSLDVPSFEGQR